MMKVPEDASVREVVAEYSAVSVVAEYIPSGVAVRVLKVALQTVRMHRVDPVRFVVLVRSVEFVYLSLKLRNNCNECNN